MAIPFNKREQPMQPHETVQHIATLSSSLGSLQNVPGSEAARKNILLQIEGLSSNPLTVVSQESSANNSERADIELFLWLRERGLDILGVAMEMLTPQDQMTPREQAYAALEDMILVEREYQKASDHASGASSARRAAETAKDNLFQEKHKAKNALSNHVERIARAGGEA